MTFKLILDSWKEASRTKIRWRKVLGRRNSKCKVP